LFNQRVLILARTTAAQRTVIDPSGAHISPGEFAADALATIQTASQPSRIGAWFDWLLVAVTVVVSYWLPRWSTGRMALVVLVCEAGYLAGAFALFHARLLALPGVLPLGLAVWILLLRVFAKRMLKVIAF
jgi:hypothetical protein